MSKECPYYKHENWTTHPFRCVLKDKLKREYEDWVDSEHYDRFCERGNYTICAYFIKYQDENR